MWQKKKKKMIEVPRPTQLVDFGKVKLDFEYKTPISSFQITTNFEQLLTFIIEQSHLYAQEK